MKKITLIVLLFCFSFSAVFARVISLTPGSVVSDVVKTAVLGDTILLTKSGTYTWNASVTVAVKNALTIIGAEELTTRPIIQFSSVSTLFGYLTFKCEGSNISFRNIDFDGNKKVNYFVVIKSSSAGFNVNIDNCIVRNLSGATNASWVLSYSNSALTPAPGYLSISNSVFSGCGEGGLVCNGAGRPDSLNMTNCYFSGPLVKGAVRTVTAKLGGAIRKVIIDHCTFDGNGNADLTIFNDSLESSTTKLLNCVFNRNSGSSQNTLGRGGDLKNHSGVYLSGATSTLFADSLLDSSTILVDPLIDPTTLVATSPLYLAAGSDGETIGYHSNFLTGIARPNRADGNGVKILHNRDGITLIATEGASVELYTSNGILLDKTIFYGMYRRNLSNGIYILRINNKSYRIIQ